MPIIPVSHPSFLAFFFLSPLLQPASRFLELVSIFYLVGASFAGSSLPVFDPHLFQFTLIRRPAGKPCILLYYPSLLNYKTSRPQTSAAMKLAFQLLIIFTILSASFAHPIHDAPRELTIVGLSQSSKREVPPSPAGTMPPELQLLADGNKAFRDDLTKNAPTLLQTLADEGQGTLFLTAEY